MSTPLTQEYGFTRSAGVFAFRPTSLTISLYSEMIVRHECVGTADDEETLIWKSSFLGTSRTILSDYTPQSGGMVPGGVAGLASSLTECSPAAVRIVHPTLGTIWYVDLSLPSVWINLSNGVLYTEDLTEPIYAGTGGEIEDLQGTVGQGVRFRLVDGSRYVSFIPAVVEA